MPCPVVALTLTCATSAARPTTASQLARRTAVSIYLTPRLRRPARAQPPSCLPATPPRARSAARDPASARRARARRSLQLVDQPAASAAQQQPAATPAASRPPLLICACPAPRPRRPSSSQRSAQRSALRQRRRLRQSAVCARPSACRYYLLPAIYRRPINLSIVVTPHTTPARRQPLPYARAARPPARALNLTPPTQRPPARPRLPT